MKGMKASFTLFFLAAAVCSSVFMTIVFAHCDTMNGPIIPEARTALEKGDINPTLKWVKPDAEAELKTAFDLARKVRTQSPEAKELADRYFLETLIRLHRAGEGAPYTGLKDTPPEAIVLLADQALAGGSAEEMIEKIQAHLAAAIREKFNAALQAQKTKDKDVESGRKFVEAYVQYMHFVEGVHAAIMSPVGHHSEGTEEGLQHVQTEEHGFQSPVISMGDGDR